MTEFALRAMQDEPGERAFLAKSWVESFSSSEMAQLISLAGARAERGRGWRVTSEYWTTWNALVNALLDRARTSVALDDAGLLAGFLCWEPWEGAACVHYVYTRLMHRGVGLARTLCAELPRGAVLYTHRSRGVTRVPEGWQYTLRPLIGAIRGKEAKAA